MKTAIPSEEQLAMQLHENVLSVPDASTGIYTPYGYRPPNNWETIGFENLSLNRVDPKLNLANMPTLILEKILRYVATPNSPPNIPMEYMNARNRVDLERKVGKRPEENYGVKDLWMCRRVCYSFYNVTQTLLKDVDFKPILVDIRIKGRPHVPKQKTLFKYYGSGSQQPAIFMNRIRHLDENILPCESIRNISINNVYIDDELVDSLGEVSLQHTKSIHFYEILGMTISEYSQTEKFHNFFSNIYKENPNTRYKRPVNNKFVPVVRFYTNNEDHLARLEQIKKQYHMDNVLIEVINSDTASPKLHSAIRKQNQATLSQKSRKLGGHKDIRIFVSEKKRYMRGKMLKLAQLAIGAEKATESDDVGKSKVFRNAVTKTFRDLKNNAKKYGGNGPSGVCVYSIAKWHLNRFYRIMNQQPLRSRKQALLHLKEISQIVRSIPKPKEIDPDVTDQDSMEY